MYHLWNIAAHQGSYTSVSTCPKICARSLPAGLFFSCKRDYRRTRRLRHRLFLVVVYDSDQ